MGVFDKEYKNLSKNDGIVFIGQSLGPLFILHVLQKYNIQLDAAIFASPFLDTLGKFWQVDLVNQTFYKTDFDYKKFKKLIPVSYVMYSNDDPYVEKEKSLDFANRLDSCVIEMKNATHVNKASVAPLVVELCKTRIGNYT